MLFLILNVYILNHQYTMRKKKGKKIRNYFLKTILQFNSINFYLIKSTFKNSL